jgi:glycosyltransferase involved in cell wall biosynthesis
VIVTVVTPTLNSAEFLADCLESVRLQISPRVQAEHIIVDGGSDDGTVELARAAGCKVIVGHDEGVFDATNKGVANSTGTLVGFLGSDDTLLPRALHRVVERFETERRPWVVGGFRWVDRQNRSLGDIAPPPRWMTPTMFAALGWCCINHMATYVTRDFYDELGGFDATYRYAGDYDFFAKALQRAPYSRVSATLVQFRRHGANMSQSSDPRVAEEVNLVADSFASRSPVRREVDREILRVWLNARNPRWCAQKYQTRFLKWRADRSAAERV